MSWCEMTEKEVKKEKMMMSGVYSFKKKCLVLSSGPISCLVRPRAHLRLSATLLFFIHVFKEKILLCETRGCIVGHSGKERSGRKGKEGEK